MPAKSLIFSPMILDELTIDKKLRRLAIEIAEKNFGESQITLAGIKENGIYIAEKIHSYLKQIFTGEIDTISIKMDKKHPEEIQIDKPYNFTGKNIVLIDDVANSGRTMLYALKPMLAYHPKKIMTLALVERTYKQFPVEINFTGLSLPTTPDEHIVVSVENGVIKNAITVNT